MPDVRREMLDTEDAVEAVDAMDVALQRLLAEEARAQAAVRAARTDSERRPCGTR